MNEFQSTLAYTLTFMYTCTLYHTGLNPSTLVYMALYFDNLDKDDAISHNEDILKNLVHVKDKSIQQRYM